MSTYSGPGHGSSNAQEPVRTQEALRKNLYTGSCTQEAVRRNLYAGIGALESVRSDIPFSTHPRNVIHNVAIFARKTSVVERVTFICLPEPVVSVTFLTRLRRLNRLFLSPLSRRNRRDERERERRQIEHIIVAAGVKLYLAWKRYKIKRRYAVGWTPCEDRSRLWCIFPIWPVDRRLVP